MRKIVTLFALAAVLLGGPATAQLGLPRLDLPVLDAANLPTKDLLDEPQRKAAGMVERLVNARIEKIDRILRRFPDLVEVDAQGNPARRGELLLLDPDAATLRAAREAGFVAWDTERLESLGLQLTRVSLPEGVELAQGEALLRRAAPGAQIAADALHFQSGSPPLPALAAAAPAARGSIATPVGMIDGAPAQRVAALRGFAKGAPIASNHGSAVASMLGDAGVRSIRAADVYGTDPAGGNALAIIRALDWLIGGGAKVISISLAGPDNAAVSKAVSAAQRRGTVVVAAVGNDGPAAPPAYPASYPGVVAVTAVDGRARPLIEAGRALHLDYAAPGADIGALNKVGKRARVRGTSYAAPLVAARAANALDHSVSWRSALDREAEDLGRPGPDDQFGRGLICRHCVRSR